MQERSHAFAMKSQVWLLDPRPNLPSIVAAVHAGFELSEASNTPVMLELRIRACHVHGRFTARDNRRAEFTLAQAMREPARDTNRIVLPPASYLHEQDKVRRRWPAAVRFIQERELNEFFAEQAMDVGIVLQGGMYNSVLRSLELLGLADAFGDSKVPLYVLNVTYPLVDAEFARFCARQARDPAGRGRPARLHRAGRELDPAQGRLRHARARQGPAADSGRIHRRADARGAPRFRRALRARTDRAARRRSNVAHERWLGRQHRRRCRAARRQRRDRSGARAGNSGWRERGAAAPAVVLHRLPGTPDLHCAQAARA